MKSSSPFNNISTFSSHAVDRLETFSEKYDLISPDIIPLSVADMDFPCMKEITEEFNERILIPNYGYSFRGRDFYSSVKNRIERLYNWKIEESWIEFTPGVGAGVAFSILSLSSPGSIVLTQPPVYPVFKRLALNNGRNVVENPMYRDGSRFVIDFDDLEKKLKNAGLLILCNPHNPTGRVFTREELERLGRLCLDNNVFIVSDEIHSDIVQETYHHTPIASVSREIAEITITLMSPGKSFNLCGLSTSFAIIPDSSLKEKFQAEANKLHIDQGNIFGVIGLQTAYDKGDEWLKECNTYISNNAVFVTEYINLNIPLIKTYCPEGTFLMWLDFRHLGLNHNELQKFLIEKARIELSDGLRYGKEGEGFMRMNIGTNQNILETALERLRKSIDEI